MILLGGDDRGAGTAGSSPYSVNPGDNSCLSDASPSSTPGSPAGGSYPTAPASNGGSTTRSVSPVLGIKLTAHSRSMFILLFSVITNKKWFTYQCRSHRRRCDRRNSPLRRNPPRSPLLLPTSQFPQIPKRKTRRSIPRRRPRTRRTRQLATPPSLPTRTFPRTRPHDRIHLRRRNDRQTSFCLYVSRRIRLSSRRSGSGSRVGSTRKRRSALANAHVHGHIYVFPKVACAA